MISKEMEKALNGQINKEMFSAYLYLSMASFLENNNYGGMASFMKIQAKEEMGHAMKIYEYVNDQGGHVVLEAIEKPQAIFTDPEEIFKLSLKHEQFISASIRSLVDQALKENDHATKIFLDWFVTEQVEEEKHMDEIVRKFEMIGKTGHAIFMMDSKLGEREND